MSFFVKFFAFFMIWSVALAAATQSSIMQMEYRVPIILIIQFVPLIWGVFALHKAIDEMMESEK